VSIPPISRGIGSLTPEVWSKMAHAADAAAQAHGSPPLGLGMGVSEMGNHWSLAGTFLARLTGHEAIDDEDWRWSYSWTHAVPYVDNADFFNIDDQPTSPNDNHTLDGEIVEPYAGLYGSADSKTHIITPTSTAFSAAYNLAEWNNTEDYQNGVNVGAESFPDGLTLQPIFDDGSVSNHPLVAMHWTRYCYGSGDGNRSSRVLFFFDRQNHFDGDCTQ